jgi:hypothetical protein
VVTMDGQRLRARAETLERLATTAVAAMICLALLSAGPGAAGAAAAVATWNNVAPASSPSPRINGAMTYDPATKQLLLFGGISPGDDFLGDTWTWNGATWTQRSPSASPAARTGAPMAYDAASGQLILFGGLTGTASSETWSWTGTTWVQLHPASSPPPQSSGAMAYDPATRQILLFGGSQASSSGTVYLKQTWAWDGATWTKLAPKTVPAARASAGMAYDTATSQLVLFGGLNSTTILSDTWLWNGSNWVKQSVGGPGPRSGASLTYDAFTSQLLLVAGEPDIGSILNDTWSWNGTGWNRLNPTTSITARYGQQAGYDSANRELVLFGGSDNPSFPDDTWLYGPLAIPPQTLLPATVGARYSAALSAIAGTPPDTWSVTSGSLPAGLSLSPAGVIAGTPTTAGTSSFTVTVMDSESPVARATRTLSLKVNPPPKAAVWVTDGGDNLIHSFPLTASGNSPPSVTIGGSLTGLNSLGGIAVDKTGAVYVSNSATPSIAVFAPGASGNVAPVRTVAGPDTGLSVPAGIALDAAGQLYVTDAGDNAITVYAAGAGGDVQPLQTISGLHTELSQPMGVVVDSAGHIWAANAAANLLTEYAAGASGDVDPIGVFRGLSTTLNNPVALAQDAAGRILAANILGESVTVFTPGPPFGNVAPTFTISGSQSQLSYPRGLDVDNANNLYVANQFGGVNVYAPNTTTPRTVITGSATGLAYPHSLAVAPPLSIATSSLPAAALGRRYTARLVADLGTAPLHWRVTKGHLPRGLKVTRAGLIRGIPRRLGTFHFTVAVTDSTRHAMRDSRRLTVTVKRAPVVTGIRPAHGPRTGLTTVTITGSGFATAARATIFDFGRLRALAVHCGSHTRCTAQAPPHAVGAVHVRATFDRLASAQTRRDRYNYTR